MKLSIETNYRNVYKKGHKYYFFIKYTNSAYRGFWFIVRKRRYNGKINMTDFKICLLKHLIREKR